MASDTSIYNHLQDRLLSGEFQPEQRLRSELLRHDYKVSASTIREVLFRLSTFGLVDFIDQRGFRMPKQSSALQHDLTQTRILLECQGACLSIRNGSVAWEARLNAAHHELKHIEMRIRACEDATELLPLWTSAELKFHRTLIEECRSDILKSFHLQVFLRFRQQLIAADKEFAFIPENVEQHQSILEAVLDHNEEKVRQRIHDHLSRNLAEPTAEVIPTQNNFKSKSQK